MKALGKKAPEEWRGLANEEHYRKALLEARDEVLELADELENDICGSGESVAEQVEECAKKARNLADKMGVSAGEKRD